jgi:hypothetical protein
MHAAFADEPDLARDGRDFCNARQRLPEAVFKKAVAHTGVLASSLAGLLFKGLSVCFADGSTVRTANSDANDRAFGRSKTVAGRSRSPVMRVVLLACAGCGAILASAIGSYDTSEQALFMQALYLLPTAALLVADRGFSTFLNFCLLRETGRHVLARLRDDRKSKRVRRLGRGDAIHVWQCPRPVHSHYPELIAECPPYIEVRVIHRTVRRKGYRTLTLKLVTTLLNPVAYPADELVELYLRRWRMETTLRTLKADMDMARLRGKSPDVVRKEVHSALLAHNSLLVLMGQSGEAPEILSAKRVRAIAASFAHYMVFAATLRLPDLFKRMLTLIRTALQPPQSRPPEPRAIIQPHSTFPVLKITRQQWRRNYHAA